MEDYGFLNDQMLLLRNDFDTLCKKPSKIDRYKNEAYISVGEMLFKSLTYGLSQAKLDSIQGLILRWKEDLLK